MALAEVVALAWASGSQAWKGNWALLMDSPTAIKSAEAVSGTSYRPADDSCSTARLKSSISRWPVVQYKMEMPSRISPEPRQLSTR